MNLSLESGQKSIALFCTALFVQRDLAAALCCLTEDICWYAGDDASAEIKGKAQATQRVLQGILQTPEMTRIDDTALRAHLLTQDSVHVFGSLLLTSKAGLPLACPVSAVCTRTQSGGLLIASLQLAWPLGDAAQPFAEAQMAVYAGQGLRENDSRRGAHRQQAHLIAAVSDYFYTTPDSLLSHLYGVPTSLAEAAQEDLSALQAALDALARRGTPVDCVYQTHMHPGAVWVRLLAKSVSKAGAPLCVTAALFDVTGDIKEQRSRHWESERYRLLLEGMTTTMMDYDPLTDYMTIYRTAKGKQAVAQRTAHYLENLERDSALSATLRKQLRDKIEELSLRPMRGSMDLRRSAGAHGERWERIHYVSIADEAGQVYRILARMSDIQEEKEREFHLQASIARETAYRDALIEGAVLAITVDGTTQQRVEMPEEILPPGLPKDTPLSELYYKFLVEQVHPEDLEVSVSVWDLNVAQAQQLMLSDDRYVEFRSRSFSRSFEGYHWFGVSLHRFQDVHSGHWHYLVYAKDIHKQKTKELTLKEKASKDLLTGLINRTSFEELCEKAFATAAAANGLAAFMLVDLDNFKAVNDTYGHIAGDEVLKSTGKCLQSMFRQDDIVARLGGDEMAVLMLHLPGMEIIHKQGAKICAKMAQMCACGDQMPLSCSVGIAVFPTHGSNFATLYQNADLALYQAKQAGKNRYCIFDEDATAPSMGEWMDKEWLMDKIGVHIYISDIKTHNMIYMSKALCETIGVHSYRNHKCYRLLQGKDAPCEFCTNHLLNYDEFYCWEHWNAKFNMRLLAKDILIDWYGAPARMEVITEVTSV